LGQPTTKPAQKKTPKMTFKEAAAEYRELLTQTAAMEQDLEAVTWTAEDREEIANTLEAAEKRMLDAARQEGIAPEDINKHVQGNNNVAPVLRNEQGSKPMATTVETIQTTVEDLKKREVLFSYANTFDNLTKASGESIQDLAHQKASLKELSEKVTNVVKSSFTNSKDVQEAFDKLKPTQQKEMLEKMVKEPKKVGKVKAENTLDMLTTQSINKDFAFHTERRVKAATELAKTRKEISNHSKHVWEVAKGYGLDAEYNEFVKAKTPAEKIESRLVQKYLNGQKELNTMVDEASPEVLGEARKQKIDFDGKLKPHTEVEKLQNRAAREQAKKQQQTQAKTQTKSQKMKA
jgi:hypothetical protein